MKTMLFLVLTIISTAIFAQKQTFDIITYTPPKGWKKEAITDKNVQAYSKIDKTNKTWCRINIIKSTASKGSIEDDFKSEWELFAVKQYKATDLNENEALEADGWKLKAGGGKFTFNNADAMVLMTTMSGYNVCVSFLITTNTQEYLATIQSFLESIDLKKPPVNGTNQPSGSETVSTVNAGNFEYSTTNFDDGWVSTVHDDYVLTQKGNIKVYLSYPQKYNASDFSGTGKQARHFYWNDYVSKYFTTGEMRYNPGGALSDYSDDYIEGWATDKQTNEKRYIAMILIYSPNIVNVIIASAPDNQHLHQQFPKADSKSDNDLKPMYSYNKFAVGKNDLVGTWVNGGGNMLTWYSTTTGNNVGSTAVAQSDVFRFNTGSSYSSIHNGASGWVGAMNTYQQEYKGNYTITPWSLTVTNRWQGKTDNYDAWFEVVKGGRILHLGSTGLTYTLVKEK